MKPDLKSGNKDKKLIPGKDFYIEKGYYVFTAEFLLRRGYCCGSGCRHCPYEPRHKGPGNS
ncbi:MAG: hypothetical protein IPM26_08350 [Saprospiraceae bacterium]|nr:hypothetical protein [Saprospiraceae bacterium]